MILAKVLFILGMSLAQARHECPKELIQVFVHSHSYYACDMGKKTLVLVIGDDDKVSAIMDLKWFVEAIDKDPKRR